ncbi:MAE_28990/MAE_18760 family HEPN-like nuclease [Asaia sp. HN128]|uniref:MAE_28990/MAE_18760 family HEPN-like nuclease n=1 Tax=Asaia sp. HN128 TaxID=3081234 RepID=UPI003016B099
MADVRTLGQFQDALDKEMSWRVKEIGVFKVASRRNSPENKPFIRAGVALTYAHWEGFIKKSSEIYIKYVDHKNLSYRDLKTCFAVFGLKSRLTTLVNSKKSVSNIDAFEFLIKEIDNTAKLDLASAVDTQSNLSSKVFCNIANSLAIDTTPYDTRFNLIDKKLVEQRNAIAHGEYLILSGADFSTLVTEVLELMRQYKTDLENAASLESYRRSI